MNAPSYHPDPRAEDAASQLVEHVTSDGEVIEIVTRSAMRLGALRHRSVYIVVLDGMGNLLIHRRAPWKDIYANAWDLAFGGICDPGETWIEAGRRELSEEAGIYADLIDCGPASFEAPDVALIARIYACHHTGPFVFDDGEVTATRWLALDQLEDFVAANEVPTDSAALITSHLINSLQRP